VTLVLQNLVLTSTAPIGGLVVTSSEMLILRAVSLVVGLAGAAFLLTGYDGCTICGGAVEFFAQGPQGFKPSSQSVFADSSLGILLTTLEGGTQNADVCLANACISGPANFSVSGLLQACYFTGGAAAFAINEVLELGYSWTQSIGCVRNSMLTLPNVHLSGNLSADNQSSIYFGNILVEAGGITLSNNSHLQGSTLNLGTAFTRLFVSASRAVITGDVTFPAADTPLQLTQGAFVSVQGALTASGNTSHGATVDSSVLVLGPAVFDNNGADGLLATAATIIFTGTLSASNNGSYGLLARQSTISLVTAATFASNMTGILLSLGSSLTTTSDLSFDDNDLEIEESARLVSQADITLINGALCLLDTGASLNANALTATAGSLTATGSTVRLGTLTVTLCTADDAVTLDDSVLEVTSAATVSNNLLRGIVCENSTLRLNNLVCNTNDGTHLFANSSKVRLTGTALFNISATGNGVDLVNASSFVADNCTIDGCVIGFNTSGRCTAAVNNLVSTAPTSNSDLGVACHAGSRMQLSGALTVSGASGDVRVGVNVTTTWSNILAQDPAFMTDYLRAQNPTELCEVAWA